MPQQKDSSKIEAIDKGIILASLPDPVLVIDSKNIILWANPSAEDFFRSSISSLLGKQLSTIINGDNPLISMILHSRDIGSGLSEYGIDISGPRIGSNRVDVCVSHIYEAPGKLVISIQPRSIAESMNKQFIYQRSARSVEGIAHLLAHEVKNPLSGIRGAAQLLEKNVNDSDRELTNLIKSETDRICSLVDNMDQFADDGVVVHEPVNIHEVLNYVRRLAVGGFGRHVRFIEHYDPSLPLASGNKNSLIQVFLNLIKNASEATPKFGAEIILSTSYQQKVRVQLSGSKEKLNLPLEITVSDNGDGVSEEIRSHIFEPFVSNKADGNGLGLALVAKLVHDHGGVVEYESLPQTLFRIRLPIYNLKATKNA